MIELISGFLARLLVLDLDHFERHRLALVLGSVSVDRHVVGYLVRLTYRHAVLIGSA